mgnify:CR=1 FL=1
MTQVQEEVERKYDVDLGAAVPDLPGVQPPVEYDLEATYFDTVDLQLQRAKITLRRRTGGTDEGWHLKLPGNGEARIEVHAPLGEADAVPTELLDRVRAHVRDHAVSPVAVLSTHRTVRHLTAEDGTVLAELCDDRVHAESRETGATPGAGTSLAIQEWREWEVELVDGDPEVFDAVDPLLRAAGAAHAGRASKVQRILADRVAARAHWRDHLGREPRTAGDLLFTHLATQVARLQEQDRLLRGGDIDEPVHQMRVAARRLRSTLATYRPLLDQRGQARAAALREDLRWLGAALAEARDMTVLRARMEELLDPDDTLTRAHLDQVLGQRHQLGLEHAADALGQTRYYRLLDYLEAFLESPAVTAEADEPATHAVPPLLRAEVKRVRKRDKQVQRAENTGDTGARDHGLHEVRKAAKRLRYAAESAIPVLGEDAEELAARAEALQDLLGEHQDAVVARQVLIELAADPEISGEVGFGLGRLYDAEQARAIDLESSYEEVRKPALRRPSWLSK